MPPGRQWPPGAGGPGRGMGVADGLGMKPLACSAAGVPTVVLEAPAFPKASIAALREVDPSLAKDLEGRVDHNADGWVSLAELASSGISDADRATLARRYYRALEAIGVELPEWHGEVVRPALSIPLNYTTGTVGAALAVGLGAAFGTSLVEVMIYVVAMGLLSVPVMGRDRELSRTLELMQAEASGAAPRG